MRQVLVGIQLQPGFNGRAKMVAKQRVVLHTELRKIQNVEIEIARIHILRRVIHQGRDGVQWVVQEVI